MLVKSFNCRRHACHMLACTAGSFKNAAATDACYC